MNTVALPQPFIMAWGAGLWHHCSTLGRRSEVNVCCTAGSEHSALRKLDWIFRSLPLLFLWYVWYETSQHSWLDKHDCRVCMCQGYLETFSFVFLWHNEDLIELFFYIHISVEVTTLEGTFRNNDIIASSWLEAHASLHQSCSFLFFFCIFL